VWRVRGVRKLFKQTVDSNESRIGTIYGCWSVLIDFKEQSRESLSGRVLCCLCALTLFRLHSTPARPARLILASLPWKHLSIDEPFNPRPEGGLRRLISLISCVEMMLTVFDRIVHAMPLFDFDESLQSELRLLSGSPKLIET
jgi:hypothetical protein